jgi:hypothetical protein
MSIVIDDGHPLSYEHQAEERLNHTNGTVTLVCECGTWSGEGTFDPETWETNDEVVSKWAAHVYQTTGREVPKREARDDSGGFCDAPVGVTLAVMSGLDIVFLWSCVQHADEWATTLEAEFGMAPERAARLTPTAKCGHQGNQSLVSVAVDSVEYAVQVGVDAVRAFNRGGAS